MEIYLFRHAPAEERDPVQFSDDSLRPLTPDGVRKMKRLAGAMRRMKLRFDLILSSPYERAKQTAGIVAAEFKLRRQLKFTEHLAPNGDAEVLIERLPALYPRLRRVLLVGHEPDLGRLAGVLVAGRETTGFKLKKAGVCKLTARRLRYAACAELDWLLTPKLLAKIAK